MVKYIFRILIIIVVCVIGITNYGMQDDQFRPIYPNFRLLHSAATGNIDGVEQSLYRGADVNFMYQDVTPLMLAVENNDIRMAGYLLYRCANPDIPSSFGITALSLAIQKRRSPDIIKMLIGTSLSSNNSKLLSLAITDDNFSAVRIFLEKYGHQLIKNAHIFTAIVTLGRNKHLYNKSKKETAFIILKSAYTKRKPVLHEYMLGNYLTKKLRHRYDNSRKIICLLLEQLALNLEQADRINLNEFFFCANDDKCLEEVENTISAIRNYHLKRKVRIQRSHLMPRSNNSHYFLRKRELDGK